MQDYDATIAGTNLDALYRRRRERLYAFMRENGFCAAVFEDGEERRDPAIRYLTGHPGDAVLVLSAAGHAALVPWDEHLAAQRAHADAVVPYNTYRRDCTEAVKAQVQEAQSAPCLRLISLPPSTTCIQYRKYAEALPQYAMQARDDALSVHRLVEDMRAQKDAYEVACTRKACAITSQMTAAIMEMVRSGAVRTEADVALFIERELRERGCERTSFDTLAAGPGRSFAIHAFPGYTAGEWGTEGLSILDYGVCYEGYASDCTITVARGPLSPEQERLLNLVQQAADECRPLYAPGKSVLAAARHAADVFAAAGLAMPHGLGHGTGLEIHEAPVINTKAKEDATFQPGNIVTLEPGLYDPQLGGCRLENDILITSDGNEVLTNSQIFRL